MKVYLAHPWLEKERGALLQKQIEALGIEVINPFQREQNRHGRLFSPLDLTAHDKNQAIVEGDLRAIEEADGIVAIVSEALSYGTHMETFYGSRILQHPVFTLLQGKYENHPWYQYLTNCYTSEAALLEALKEWVKK